MKKNILSDEILMIYEISDNGMDWVRSTLMSIYDFNAINLHRLNVPIIWADRSDFEDQWLISPTIHTTEIKL